MSFEAYFLFNEITVSKLGYDVDTAPGKENINKMARLWWYYNCELCVPPHGSSAFIIRVTLLVNCRPPCLDIGFVCFY